MIPTRREVTAALLAAPATLLLRAPPAAAQQTDPAAFAGTWRRMEGGTLAETLEIAVSGNAVTLRYFTPDGSANGSASGTLANGLLLAQSPRRLVAMTERGGQLAYASTDHDGTNRWDGIFTR